MPARRSTLLKKYARKGRRRRGMKNPKEELIINSIAVIIVIIIVLFVINALGNGGKTTKVGLTKEKIAAFAVSPKTLTALNELSIKYNLVFSELIALYSLHNDFYPSKLVAQSKEEIEQSFIINYDKIKNSYKSKDLEPYEKMFKTLFDEIKYFPIMDNNLSDGEPPYMFGDSFGGSRNYEGERTHEGCDIMDRENIRGRIPIASMTDGIIEDIGWTNLGGFQIGVRAQSGNYYYYAHLDKYADSLIKGNKVVAGQLLGYMGDTGYSKKEGTTGNFPVHLHVGIEVKTSIFSEPFWINPYPFLRFYEMNKSIYG